MFKNFLYGVCYYPEHWDPKRHESDIRRIKACGFNFVRMGEGAWSYWEPREGEYQFDLFDRVIDLCRKHDLKVMLGTPTYCAPAWVCRNYPEVLRWDFNRRVMDHGSRRNFNYTSPKYLELSDRICTALAEHYKNEKQVISWQLDNEFNCHMDLSYAPSDTIAFRAWLRKKYKTLDRLNEAWGTRFWSQTYNEWDEIDLPHPTSAPMNPTQILDETRFISDCVIAFARRQAAILRKHNPNWKITHNGLFQNIEGPKLVEDLDFFCHDQYPLFYPTWTDQTFGLQQARSLSFPFGIAEQQAGAGGQMDYFQRTPHPGELRLWVWQSIFHGAKLVSYFRWRTCPYGSEQRWHGLLDHDDKDNRRIAEAKRTGAEIRSLPNAFYDSPITRCIAVVRDFDNHVNDRRINTYTKNWGNWEDGRWLGAIARAHVPGDITWLSSDWRGYKILVAPHLKIVDRADIDKFTQFVRAGGILVLASQSGLKNHDLHMVEMTPPGLFTKLAGVEVEEWSFLPDAKDRQARLPDGREISLHTYVEKLRPTTAETVATWLGDPLLSPGAAITRNKVGKGFVYYVGGYSPETTCNEFVQYLIEAHNLPRLAIASPEVETIARGKYLTLANHSPLPQRVDGVSGKEMITCKPIRGTEVTLPPYGVAVIQR
jgi:beta-galactosidase